MASEARTPEEGSVDFWACIMIEPETGKWHYQPKFENHLNDCLKERGLERSVPASLDISFAIFHPCEVSNR